MNKNVMDFIHNYAYVYIHFVQAWTCSYYTDVLLLVSTELAIGCSASTLLSCYPPGGVLLQNPDGVCRGQAADRFQKSCRLKILYTRL